MTTGFVEKIRKAAREQKEKELRKNRPPRNPAEANQKLLEAAVIGVPAEVREALEYGADINHTDNEGNNALMLEADNFYFEYAETNFNVLIKNGIDINKQNIHGETAIMLLVKGFSNDVERSDKRCMRAAFTKLVKHGSDITIPDNNKKEVLDVVSDIFLGKDNSMIEYCLEKSYKYAKENRIRIYVNKKKYTYEQMLASSDKNKKSLTANQLSLKKDYELS